MIKQTKKQAYSLGTMFVLTGLVILALIHVHVNSSDFFLPVAIAVGVALIFGSRSYCVACAKSQLFEKRNQLPKRRTALVKARSRNIG